MITKENLLAVLQTLGFVQTESDKNIYSKRFEKSDCEIKVDFTNEKIIYPEELNTGDNTTCNFSHPENFVVLECVYRLLELGYKTQDIFLEKEWTLGHESKKSGKADITVYKDGKSYLIIECKNSGKDYSDARKELFNNPKQLFSYFQQERSTQWLQLYASDFDSEKKQFLIYEEIIRCYDDENIIRLSEQDESVLIYKNSSTAEDAFVVWEETYAKKTYQNLVFGQDAVAYNIGNKPIKNKDLKQFNKDDGIINQFREILRYNAISDKENAFNKMLSLFICKFVDEERNNDENSIMAFQYIDGKDDYYKLYERLLALFQIGMKDFLREDVYYLENDYIRKTLEQFTGKKRQELEKELTDSFQKTKMLSCQVFAFKEVYNEKLFFQNGKVLVEMVELLQNYRIAYSNRQQFLGELFENLLNAGFKQEAGQFFTPIPITRFVWNSLPLEKYLESSQNKLPKVIDFACGSAHFLTEGVSALKEIINKPEIDEKEISRTFYGCDKDNRLSRVSKLALLLNGAQFANIKACDGLEHDENFLGELNSFDILVANPPFSVDGFKAHESRTVQKTYETIKLMSMNCSNIQNVFIERMQHLLKPKGIAAIVMPSSFITNSDSDEIKAREILLSNFNVKSIIAFSGKTFGETATNTVILFLEHFDFPPHKEKLYEDSATSIVSGENLLDWQDAEILTEYLKTINVEESDYKNFFAKKDDCLSTTFVEYFENYKNDFVNSTECKKIIEKIKEIKQKESCKILLKKNEKSSIQLQNDLNTKFYAEVKKIEKDKLIYFALTYKQKTLIITSPSNITEQREFLGYDVTHRRGDEGLKESEGLLTNKTNRNDKTKIAYAIKNSFSDVYNINENLKKYAKTARLADLLDFSRTTFNKAIKLSAQKKVEITSKYPLVKLGEVAEIIAGQSPKSEYYNDNQNGVAFYQGKKDFGSMYLNNPTVWTSFVTKESIKDDILMSVRAPVGDINLNPYEKICIGRGLAAIRPKSNILLFYLFNYLQLNQKHISGHGGSIFDSISTSEVASIKIPLPPLDIQQKIVTECSAIDANAEENKIIIEQTKKQIEEIMNNVSGKMVKLKNLCITNPSKSEISNLSDEIIISFIEMASVSNDGFIETKVDKPLKELKKGSYTYFSENDIILAKITPCMENGKCGIATNLTNKIALGSSEFHVFRCNENIKKEYLFNFLNRKEIRLEAEKNMTGASGHRRVPISFYENLQIPLPPLADQQKIIEQITSLEQKIARAKTALEQTAMQKQQVLKRWL